MTARITDKDLNNLVNRLNAAQGITEAKYNTMGAYVLEYAYGGVKLARVCNEHGATRDISAGGYGTKRALYEAMLAIINHARAA